MMSINPLVISRTLRPSFCLLTAVFGTVAALAGPGSRSSSASSLQYSFVLNGNSIQYAQDLEVTDFGLTTYNLVNQNSGAYGAQSGYGNESASVLPSTF